MKSSKVLDNILTLGNIQQLRNLRERGWHGAVLFGKLTFPRVTENDSMKASSPGDESRLKSKVTLGSVQPSK